jgi:hypothetical protein
MTGASRDAEVAAARGTPMDWLSDIHPVDLSSHAVAAVVECSGIDSALISGPRSRRCYCPHESLRYSSRYMHTLLPNQHMSRRHGQGKRSSVRSICHRFRTWAAIRRSFGVAV